MVRVGSRTIHAVIRFLSAARTDCSYRHLDARCGFNPHDLRGLKDGFNRNVLHHVSRASKVRSRRNQNSPHRLFCHDGIFCDFQSLSSGWIARHTLPTLIDAHMRILDQARSTPSPAARPPYSGRCVKGVWLALGLFH